MIPSQIVKSLWRTNLSGNMKSAYWMTWQDNFRFDSLSHIIDCQKKAATTSSTNELDQARNDFEDQMLELRKELLGEIREVQDSIAELNFRIKRLESKK